MIPTGQMEATYTLPELTVEVAGRPWPTAALIPLAQVWVRQTLSLPTQAELVFNDPPGPLTEAERVTPGDRLQLRVVGQTAPLFDGQVTVCEQLYLPDGQRQVRLRAYDLMHALRKRQRLSAHVQTTPRELVQELTADLGLIVQATTDGPLWERVIQHNQTDHDLLVDLLARCGLYYTLREQTLHLITLDGLEDEHTLTWRENLLETRLMLSGEPATRQVTALGWNPMGVENFQGRADQPRSGRQTTAAVTPTTVLGVDERWLVGHGLADDLHGEALAQAELDRRTAGEVTVWGVVRGDPTLRPGSRVTVQAVADALAGTYVLAQVIHRIDAHLGFISEISSEPPPTRVRPAAASATLGVVTAVDDPEGLGRVRVSLPAYDNVETDWLQVVSPAAGVHKGLVALPDVEDNVLVLLLQADHPEQGIVLGGLYGPFAPYDPGVEGSATQRYSLRTTNGHLLRLDDHSRTLRLENSQGSFVEMAPGKVRLHATADLELSAPGRRIVIRGGHIEFEQA